MSLKTVASSGAGGGASAAGSNTQIQYNSSGSLAGSSNLVYDYTNVRVGIGTSAPSTLLNIYAVTANLLVEGDSGTNNIVYRSSTDSTGPVYNLRKARGTTAARTAVASGDILGTINWQAYGGTNVRSLAIVRGTVGTYTSDTDISAYLIFLTTPTGSVTALERMRITESGNVGIGTSSIVNKLDINGSFGRNAPVTKTSSFTLADTENWIICNGSGSITVTFPAASSWTGREVMIKTIANQTVVSASSNVVPLDSSTAGTAILAATAGKWATLVSDGSNWIIMQAA